MGMSPSSSAADNGPSGLLSLKVLHSIMHQSSLLQLRKTEVAMKAVEILFEEHPSQQEGFLQMLINGEKDKYVMCDKRQGASGRQDIHVCRWQPSLLLIMFILSDHC